MTNPAPASMGEECPRCLARARDPWGPDPEDPFWMIEDDSGEWLKNTRTLLGTRDPALALRFPTAEEARQAIWPNWPSRWFNARVTEHTWIQRALRPCPPEAMEQQGVSDD